jgi:hypothetical protein
MANDHRVPLLQIHEDWANEAISFATSCELLFERTTLLSFPNPEIVNKPVEEFKPGFEITPIWNFKS